MSCDFVEIETVSMEGHYCEIEALEEVLKTFGEEKTDIKKINVSKIESIEKYTSRVGLTLKYKDPCTKEEFERIQPFDVASSIFSVKNSVSPRDFIVNKRSWFSSLFKKSPKSKKGKYKGPYCKDACKTVVVKEIEGYLIQTVLASYFVKSLPKSLSITS